MRPIFLFSFFIILSWATASGQTAITVVGPDVYDLLKGNYNPADYMPSTLANHPADVIEGLAEGVSPDSLKAYLEVLSTFENRNTGSDTLSEAFGIGAARRWAYSQFAAFSTLNEGRLRPAYLQFGQDICGMGQHRNIFAVLPGIGPHRDELVIVEAHIDSRCEDGCDVGCQAHGMEDNGSGTALVLELARVMSAYAFDRSLVFLITIGEEQGLYGANAFAEFCKNESIPVRAVYNNDIVGGIICGHTASPPGCPGLNDVDSINVRLFSSSGTRNLARFARLEYEENLLPVVAVPSILNIMSQEDRTGRGGDHIPFRQRGYQAMRFTSANEHGDGNPDGPNYEDRQHSMADVLGVDTDGDSVIDSFFVDFHYLARNAVINGNAAAMSALGPVTPLQFKLEDIEGGFRYEFDDPDNYGLYRIGIRTFGSGNYFDTLLTVTQTADSLFSLLPGTPYYLTVCSVDSNGIESQFSNEVFDFFTTGTTGLSLPEKAAALLQNRPNPFDEVTTLGVFVERPIIHSEAYLLITDTQGRELARYPLDLQPGLHEVVYNHWNQRQGRGLYYFSLVVDGQVFETKAMINAY